MPFSTRSSQATSGMGLMQLNKIRFVPNPSLSCTSFMHTDGHCGLLCQITAYWRNSRSYQWDCLHERLFWRSEHSASSWRPGRICPCVQCQWNSTVGHHLRVRFIARFRRLHQFQLLSLLCGLQTVVPHPPVANSCCNCRAENDDSAEAVTLDGEGGVYVAGTIGLVQEVLLLIRIMINVRLVDVFLPLVHAFLPLVSQMSSP
jgi:hypothetical protein